MPLGPKRLHNRIRDWLTALLTLGRIAIGMAIHAPRIPILLHERGFVIEWLYHKSAYNRPHLTPQTMSR
jgi:hypothetical protein